MRILFILGFLLVLGGALFFIQRGGEDLQRSEVLPEERKELSDSMGEIMVTDGTKHTIPLDEIVSGGVPQDGIPSIDEPKFVSVQEASAWLDEEDPGIAVDLNGVRRFYPYQILVWHEIVNDSIGDQGVLVTYCPLCFSGIVFDPSVEGERTEFGVSGKLWNSNLLMYDRRTESLWSQILGEAVVGEYAGTKLDILPYDITSFGKWGAVHSEGQVLSRDTGARKFYGHDPYGSYYTDPQLYFPVGNRDERLPSKEFVLGVIINEQAKAYSVDAVREAGIVRDEFAGVQLSLEYDADLDSVRIFREKENGSKEQVNPFSTFWFTWAAVYPETDVFPSGDES